MKSVNKKIHLEIIRIIALVCIVYNHTGERGNNVYLFTNGDITFIFSLISDILCKIGVPLFLMVSGALLLQKEESWQEIYHKRVLRIVKVIVLFTTLRYFYECFYVKKIAFSVIGLLKAIFAGNMFIPYWFLYAYLSILLILPFIKKMVKSMEKKELDILVMLIMGFYVILPCISALVGWYFEISFMIGINCCYCILGYYIEHIIDKSAYTGKNIILAAIAIFSGVAFSYWLVARDKVTTGVIAGEYNSILSMLIAFSLFYIIKAVFVEVKDKDRNNLFTKIVTTVGSCAFGIYLIEDYLRNGLAFIYDSIAPYVTTLPACAVWLTAVMIAGVVIVSLLKKIPGLKEIL